MGGRRIDQQTLSSGALDRRMNERMRYSGEQGALLCPGLADGRAFEAGKNTPAVSHLATFNYRLIASSVNPTAARLTADRWQSVSI